jgi:hypothetical protein
MPIAMDEADADADADADAGAGADGLRRWTMPPALAE